MIWIGALVVLATLVLGDLVAATRKKERSVSSKFVQLRRRTNVHVLREAVEVLLLLLELGLKLQKLLTLTAADGVVLVGLLAALEGVAGEDRALVSG
jgi:hypothetical protein